MSIKTIEERLERLEARNAIAELPARYARAVDSRDIEGWANLFIEDVDCGRYGKGRDALKKFIEPAVRTFYRSIHYLGGHVIDFESNNRATGTVYCRAEHEDGDEWVVMGIVYFDTYVRRDGEWFFEKRSEKHWYSADVLDRPHSPFQLWKRWADRTPHLPQDFPTWDEFWKGSSAEELAKITRQP